MDLRYLSKRAPTVLAGHDGKNITSIQFQKSKTKTEKSGTSSKSRTQRNIQNSSSAVNIINNENQISAKEPNKNMLNISTTEIKDNKIINREETKFSTKSSRQTDKLLEKSNMSEVNVSQNNYKTEDILFDKEAKKKSYYDKPSYGEHLSSKSKKSTPDEVDGYGNHADAHLSDYGVPVSMHSSVVSSSSRSNVKEIEIPPIIQIPENNIFEDDFKNDYRMLDVEMKDDKMLEYDDFTQDQKQYVENLLDNKLSQQREKMMDYFQNMQIEMIRQFQIQYLELTDVIEVAVKTKERNKFINKYIG
jgi:hypothetical protein